MDAKLIYDTFITDISILTLTQLSKKFGYGSKRYLKMCVLLYEIYGKEHIKHISSARLAKHRNNIRNSKPVRYSDESKQRMSAAQRKYWKDAPNERYEISRQLYLTNVLPNSQTPTAKAKRVQSRKLNGLSWHSDSTKVAIGKSNSGKIRSKSARIKMSKSAIRRGNNLPVGFKHSNKTRNALSKITKQQWKDGIHKAAHTSKGQLELYNHIKHVHPDAVLEHFVNGRPFDIFVPSKNLLVEFNGTYLHYDPRKYDKNYFDVSKNRYAKDVWKIDAIKAKMAKDLHYTVCVVWQFDWDTKDRLLIVKDLLK